MELNSSHSSNMGAAESIPVSPQVDDVWWGDDDKSSNVASSKEVQTDPEERNNFFDTGQPSNEAIIQIKDAYNQEIETLKLNYKTELDALNQMLKDKYDEIQILQIERKTIKSSKDSESKCEEVQTADSRQIQDKLEFYTTECERLKMELKDKQMAANSSETEANKDKERHELQTKLALSTSENNELKSTVSALQVQCIQLKSQVEEIENLKISLEQSVLEISRLESEIAETKELRSQLAEAQMCYKKMTEKFSCEESRWAAESQQRTQQTKWEMTSLQTCVDNLLKENTQLRNDLTQISHTLTDSRDKFHTNELYVEKLVEQVTALKDVVSIGKQMLGMRDAEMEQLQRKLTNLEDMLETEREKNAVLSSAFSPDVVGNATLKNEYEAQLSTIRSLKEIYNERLEIVGMENQALKDTIEDKSRQISLIEKRYRDLEANHNLLRDTLNKKEVCASELQDRICSLAEECRSLTNQLSMISNLFCELGKSDVDLERLHALQEAMAESLENGPENTTNLSKVWCALSELLENSSDEPPQPVEGSEGCYKCVNTPCGPRLVISVSQTFLRLRDLIFEKKSLKKEVGQLRQLNTHLETKLQQQEHRLVLVLEELKKTWAVVNKMRSQHSQLRSSEAVLRYDLQSKRKLVNKLKEELEECRELWKEVRKRTFESEEQWKILRDEFASRRRHPLRNDDSTEINSAESGYSDGRADDESGSSDDDENTGDITGSEPSSESQSPDNLPTETSRPESITFSDSTLSTELDADVMHTDAVKPNVIPVSGTLVINATAEISPTVCEEAGVFVTSSKAETLLAETAFSDPSGSRELGVAHLDHANKPQSIPAAAAAVSNDSVIAPDTINKCTNTTMMSSSTGAIKKVHMPNSDSISITPQMPSDAEQKPKIQVEEILDARAARLKRLEEQCSQLFRRVVRTSNMSVAISNRLEELHEQYGETEESKAAKRKMCNSLQSEAQSNPIEILPTVEVYQDSRVPIPPPLPPGNVQQLSVPRVKLNSSKVKQETSNAHKDCKSRSSDSKVDVTVRHL